MTYNPLVPALVLLLALELLYRAFSARLLRTTHIERAKRIDLIIHIILATTYCAYAIAFSLGGLTT